jgi:hypothetical protein
MLTIVLEAVPSCNGFCQLNGSQRFYRIHIDLSPVSRDLGLIA